MAYRMLHIASKNSRNPCYITKSGGIISPDKSKSRVWKTWTGASNAWEKRYKAAGYIFEYFDPNEDLTRIKAIKQISLDTGSFCAAEIYDSLIKAGFKIIAPEQKAPVSK